MIWVIAFLTVYLIIGVVFVAGISSHIPFFKRFREVQFWLLVLTWPIGAYLIIKGDL